MLGTIALAGMIMRNAVILVDQIGQDMDQSSLPGMPLLNPRSVVFGPLR